MSVSVEFSYYTCSDCGATFGYPSKYRRNNCPFCLLRERNDLENRMDEKNEELSKQYRSICGLKGAITRLKNK